MYLLRTCRNDNWLVIWSLKASEWMFDRLGLWSTWSVMRFFNGTNVPLPISVNLGIPLMTSCWSSPKPMNDSLSKWEIGFAFILRYANGISRISAGILGKWLPFKNNVWTLTRWENILAGKLDISVLPKSKRWNLKCYYLILFYLPGKKLEWGTREVSQEVRRGVL